MPLEDLIRPGLALVFIGFNPSQIAWERGHYYANPVNRFYRLLHESGLTPRLYRPEEDRSLLDLSIGAVDLLPGKPSPRAGDYPAHEFRSGVEPLREKIEAFGPRAVCCNGYGVFQYLYGRTPDCPGLQEGLSFGGSLVFATPSTSGLANGKHAERLRAFAEMSEWMKGIEH
ncbi:MAG: mismatch-specific DNA-glycosylase [Armatimonadetes bacterium]|nr:mismatch-specific DNA-glycosylase [Armatimonadota bacterium]